MRAALPLFLLAAIAGCDRCGERAAAVDAGAAPQSPGALPATDLRSALVLAFPEFRGAIVTSGRAAFTRTVGWSGKEPLEAALQRALAAKGWTGIAAADGAVTAGRPPFQFRGGREGERVALEIWLPLDNDDVGNLLYATSAIGTEHLASMLPAPEGARDPKDAFALELEYLARPGRANFLVNQLADGLAGSGWKVEAREEPDGGTLVPGDALPLRDGGVLVRDGGAARREERLPDGGVAPQPESDPVPPEARIALHDAHHGGRISIDRRGGAVRVRYAQPIAPPRPR